MNFYKLLLNRLDEVGQEKRKDLARRAAIENYMKSRKIEKEWKERTTRGNAPQGAATAYLGPDQRSGKERRSTNIEKMMAKPKKTSIKKVETVLGDYTKQGGKARTHSELLARQRKKGK